jgi:K+-sensing histidine kinase KdpD
LFKPFKELRKKDNIQQVENHSIGIGLTSSKEICTELDGTLHLEHSMKGLTVFSFQLPVIVEDSEDDGTFGLELQY